MRLRLEALAQAAWPEEWPHRLVCTLRAGEPLPPDPLPPLRPPEISRLAEKLRPRQPAATGQLRRLLALPVWWLPWLPGHPSVIGRLPTRVRNVFRRRGILADRAALRALTAQRFLSLTGLGWRSLVDLVALEESLLATGLTGGTDPGPPGRLTRVPEVVWPPSCQRPHRASARRDLAASRPQAVAEPVAATSLDEEIELIVRRVARSSRDADIVLRRFGMRGQPPETLQQIADRYALSRERVRQIVARFERRLRRRTGNVHPVHLARLVDEWSARSPLTSWAARQILARHSELCRDIDGVLRFAAAVRLPVDGVRIAADEPARSLRPALRAAMQAIGVGHVDEVRAVAKQQVRRWTDGSDVEAERLVVRAAVHADAAFEWLDAEQEWFWRPRASRQPIGTRVRKMLWIAGELTLREIAAGLGRDRRLCGRVPPDHVLAAVLTRLDHVVATDDGRYALAPEARDRAKSPLNNSEALVVGALRQEGGAATLRRMEALLVETERMPAPTLQLCLTGPLVHRPARGVYSPVGHWPSQEAIQDALERGDRTPNRIDVRRVDTDMLEIRICAGDSLVHRGMLSLPPGIARLFASDYTLHHDGLVRTIRTKQATQWGYSPLVRHLRLRQGDVLSLAVSVRERAIVVVDLERAAKRV